MLLLKKPSESKEQLLKTLEIDSKDSFALILLAYAYLDLGDKEEAQHYLIQAEESLDQYSADERMKESVRSHIERVREIIEK